MKLVKTMTNPTTMHVLKIPSLVVITLGLLIAQCLTLVSAQSGGANSILPRPTSLSVDAGSMQLTASARIIFSTRSAPRNFETSLEPLANVLAGEIELVTGFRPTVFNRASATPGPGDIALEFETIAGSFAATEAEEDQSYRMTVGDSVVISSQYYKGVAYGTSSLVHALQGGLGNYSVPKMRIDDRPANPYRAVMIDIARQRHSADSLKDVVRLARQYKVRYVHLHLTDDQNFVFPFNPVTDNVSSNYTLSRSELIDMVNYADARGVTIIPELDLPGHSTKLRQSGYLTAPADTDRDVAAPHNYGNIQGIIDDMLSVFQSTPYFHIGGDESGAGSNLVPFLGAMNRHIRTRGRRMLVWEGFHGAPINEIPATGPDRVIVMSWESTYNAPWDLLNSGYTVINASWRPLYLVSGGQPIHPGTGVRRWPAEEIYAWDADTFMHWEPGRPVYNDVGPNDPDLQDSTWKASYIGREAQMLGGQLLFWEASDQYIIAELRRRLPALAERLWNPGAGSYAQHAARLNAADGRTMMLVRPIEILPETTDPTSPINEIYRIYDGDSIDVTLRNRTNIQGDIRYETDPFDGQLSWIHSGTMQAPTSSSPAYQSAINQSGGFGVRAQLYRPDGTAVDGVSWEVLNNWKQRVSIREYRRGRDEYPLSDPVPDLTQLDSNRFIRSYQMPSLRGPLQHIRRDFQLQEATLNIETGGDYTVYAQTQSGRATLFLDLNGNGTMDSSEAIIRDTPPSEQRLEASVSLAAGQYALRLDHMSDQPRSALIVSMSGPDTGNQRRDISSYLLPLSSEPQPDPENLALGKPATESSLEGASDRTADQAVDGDRATRWASQYSDPQWMQVDLGARYNIERVVLYWETAHGKAYEIQVSDDASNWRAIYTTTSSDGGTDDLNALSGAGRYIRMYGTERGTQWGYSLWEFEVYGSPADSDPTLPAVSVVPTSVSESAGNATVVVQLSEAANSPVSVLFATRGDTAQPSQDFYGLSQTVQFAAGETEKRVEVSIVNDSVGEANERFVARLLEPDGAEIGAAEAFVTIIDDDGSPDARLSIADITVNETAGTAIAVVTLSQPVDATVSIHSRPGSAIGSEDYYGFTRQLTFSGGQQTQRVPVTILNDTVVEPTETLQLRLFDASGASIDTELATVTINDDDGNPSIASFSVGDLSVDESAGTVNAAVTLSQPVDARVSIYSRAVSATGGDDYYGLTRELIFSGGQQVLSVPVTILDDTLVEPTETFELRLFNASGASIRDASATVTINDNDSGPSPQLSINDVRVDEGAGSATMTVSLDRAPTSTVSVNVSTTADGTATPADDFVSSEQTLSFAPGSTSQSFDVSIVDDTIDESDETVVVTLTDPANAGIADGRGEITISDNDDAPRGGGALINIKSQLCVAAKDGNTGNGVDIIQDNCADVSHQRFTFRPRSDGYGNIQASHAGSDGCLTVRFASGVVGQPIEQHACTDDRNHVWAPVDSWDNRERIQFKARSTGMCLTVKEGSFDAGTILVQEPCRRGDASQLWETTIADDYIGKGAEPPVAGVAVQSHGVQGFYTFGDGVIQQDAWTAGDIAFYFPQGQLTDTDVISQWHGWFVRSDQLYRQMSARPDFDSVFRANDPNFGRKKVLGVVEGPNNTCGTVNAAGCGNKQQAQASSGYINAMLRDPFDWREHWIFFYEMGRGGSPERFYGRATWPTNTVIFPHLMAGLSFHAAGGDAGIERGIPGLLLDSLVEWEHSGKEFVDEYATRQSHDLIAAMLYRILQDNDPAAIARILRNMEQKPQPSSAVQAMCDFQDAVNAAVGGYSQRMKGPWGLPDNC